MSCYQRTHWVLVGSQTLLSLVFKCPSLRYIEKQNSSRPLSNFCARLQGISSGWSHRWKEQKIFAVFLPHFLALKKNNNNNKNPEGEFLWLLSSGYCFKSSSQKVEYFEVLLGRHMGFFTPKKLHSTFWPERYSQGEASLCVVKIHFLTEQSLPKVSSVVGILKAFVSWNSELGNVLRQTLLNILLLS